jgi:hypothetical protein
MADFEYFIWGKPPLREGDYDELLPRCDVPVELVNAMYEAPDRPPFQGSVKKRYHGLFEGMFLDWGNPLLAPEQPADTATWLRGWAAGAPVGAGLLVDALRVATWLESAVRDGWYVDWERS